MYKQEKNKTCRKEIRKRQVINFKNDKAESSLPSLKNGTRRKMIPPMNKIVKNAKQELETEILIPFKNN